MDNTRIARSFALAGEAWGVLRSDKKLLVFPALAVPACLITAGVILGLGVRSLAHATGPAETAILVLMVYALAAGLNYMLAIMNVALISAAAERLQGREPSLVSALGIAIDRLFTILSWVLLSTTVSLILRSMEKQEGLLGRLARSVLGLAWSLATYLLLPVLVCEDLGLKGSLQRSTDLFRNTWGEHVAAKVGFDLIWLILSAPGLVALALGGDFDATVGNWAVAGDPLGWAGLIWVTISMVLVSALRAIFLTALYRYAARGESPEAFGRSRMRESFA